MIYLDDIVELAQPVSKFIKTATPNVYTLSNNCNPVRKSSNLSLAAADYNGFTD
jgi:hypothetical protein